MKGPGSHPGPFFRLPERSEGAAQKYPQGTSAVVCVAHDVLRYDMLIAGYKPFMWRAGVEKRYSGALSRIESRQSKGTVFHG